MKSWLHVDNECCPPRTENSAVLILEDTRLAEVKVFWKHFLSVSTQKCGPEGPRLRRKLPAELGNAA